MSSAAVSKDADYQKLLNQVDVSHPNYGMKTYGQPKVNVFHLRDRSVLLVYQARYGGDGEHTENLLKLFKFQDNKGQKLIDQDIDSVEFVEKNGILKEIKGKYVATLCDVCDGWEVSDPDDVFFIPIVIDIDSLRVKPLLSEKEKKELTERLEQKSNKNLAEQLSYGNKYYPTHVAKVKKGVNDIIGRK